MVWPCSAHVFFFLRGGAGPTLQVRWEDRFEVLEEQVAQLQQQQQQQQQQQRLLAQQLADLAMSPSEAEKLAKDRQQWD